MSDHLVGLAMKRRFPHLRWISHFSDPWAQSSYRADFPPFRLINERLERKVVEASDLVIFTSDETLDFVMSGYPDSWRTKARVLPHAFDRELYPAITKSRPASSVPILRHLGNFYDHRNPVSFLKAIAGSLGQAKLSFRIELIGSMSCEIKRAIDALRLPEEFVRVLSPVSYEESLKLMRSADGLIVIDAPDEQNVFFPSKLVDYLGAEKPILAITPPGTSERIVRDAGGWCIRPGSPSEMSAGFFKALRELQNGFSLTAAQLAFRNPFEARQVAATLRQWIESPTVFPPHPIAPTAFKITGAACGRNQR
jgi:glycosyltransferase involved in cell wall biosynthesis